MPDFAYVLLLYKSFISLYRHIYQSYSVCIALDFESE